MLNNVKKQPNNVLVKTTGNKSPQPWPNIPNNNKNNFTENFENFSKNNFVHRELLANAKTVLAEKLINY